MAWSIGDYNEFLEVAGDVFGLTHVESKMLYEELSDVLGYGSLTYDDLVEYADVASSLVEAFPGFVFAEPVEKELEYDYEFDWVDEQLEPGDELEITAELRYE